MNIEQAKEILEKIKISTSMNATPIISNDELQDSLDVAIKSLDMWDKVEDKIKNFCRNVCEYPYEMCETCKVENITEIIKKYKEEV